MNKTIHTVVDDIYRLMETKEADESVDVEAEIEKFGESMKSLMRTEFARDRKRDTRTLRLSNIGRDDRYLWNVVNGTETSDKIKPHTYVKFMYGHLIEEMLLFLTRMAGHEVTDEQKVCEVEGIRGHMDCTIDGVTVDVKSASSFAFKKFKDGTLAMNDSFGYVDQLKAYAHAQGKREIAWLAMDKANGHLTVLKYDLDDTQAPVHKIIDGDIEERIIHVKEMVKGDEPEGYCQDPVAEGKSGNMKLSIKCSYCQYKKHCYPDLRAFLYSTGPKFFSHIEVEPKVQEIDID